MQRIVLILLTKNCIKRKAVAISIVSIPKLLRLRSIKVQQKQNSIDVTQVYAII